MSAGDVVNSLSEPVKHGIDVLSIGALLTTLLGWLPAISAVVALLWGLMRMYESYLTICEKIQSRKERRMLFEAAMRKQYQDTLSEDVPPDMKHLLGKLK